MNKRKKNNFKRYLIGLSLVIVLAVTGLNINSNKALAVGDSCTAPTTTYGTDTMTMNITQATTYTIWTRMNAPSSASDSILLSIDGTNCYNVGGNGSTTMNYGSWQWINYNDGSSANVISLSLSAGSHTFVLTGTESGVSIDRIEALSDNTCVPTGTGDNCLNSTTTPTVAISTPAGGSTVSGSQTISADASETGGTIASVQYMLDGNNLGGPVTTSNPNNSSEYDYSWDTTSASNGSHTLTAVATDSNGNSTTSAPITVTVNNSTSNVPTTPTVSVVPTPSSTSSFTYGSTPTTQFTTSSSIPLEWTASTESGATIAGYAIYEDENGTYTKIATTTSTSYTVTGLSPATSYSFEVAAYDSAPTVNYSPNSTAVTTKTFEIGAIDGNSTVEGHDLSLLIDNYDKNYAPAEFDTTPYVEGHDLSLLIDNYGK